jgi:glutaredoxin
MHQQGQKLLEAFDQLGTAQGAPLALGALGDAAQWRPVAEELMGRGWLRRTETADTFIRTEDGRLAIAGPLDVTLYTRPGCHLCEEAKAQMAPLLRWAGARLREVNIDADLALRERYNVDVPVIFLGARKVAKHRVDLQQFRRQLEAARREKS